MKSLIKKVVLILIVIITFSACAKDSPANLLVNSPKCRIVSQSSLIVPSFGFSTMTFKVENNGDGPTAYDISIYVKLKKGNYIVDESGINMGTLEQGESKSEDVTFTKVKSNSEYDKVEVNFYWYDAQGTYYH
jgi:hypothetical protein